MIRTEEAICARCEKFDWSRDKELAAKAGTGFCLIHERPVQWNGWACGPLWDRAPNMRQREVYIERQQARESQQQGENHAAE